MGLGKGGIEAPKVPDYLNSNYKKTKEVERHQEFPVIASICLALIVVGIVALFVGFVISSAEPPLPKETTNQVSENKESSDNHHGGLDPLRKFHNPGGGIGWMSF
jgi:hypothetical protein